MKRLLDKTILIGVSFVLGALVMDEVNIRKAIPICPTNAPVTESRDIIINNIPNKVYKVRVTAYISDGRKSALNDTVQSGKTAAVSPACINMLGEKVYIEGHGIRYINDLTAKSLDDRFGICTVDLAVGSKTEMSRIGSNIRTVVILKN